MNTIRLTLVLMALLVSPGTPADQADQRLGPLFEELRAADEAEQARFVEQLIWRIWLESGQPEVNALMAQGMAAMARRQMDAARAVFDQVVILAPEYAEGWNKRATVYYLADDLAASMRDIERTLALEPRHFGALSGMGLIFAEIEDVEGALRAFEAALEIHPMSPTAQASAEELREKLRDQTL